MVVQNTGHVIQTGTRDKYTALSFVLHIYEFLYKFDTVLYQFLETGTSDITFMGRDQELKLIAFSLYHLSFFLYTPFKSYYLTIGRMDKLI